MLEGTIDPEQLSEDVWYNIATDVQLSKDFIEKFHPYMYWSDILYSQKLSEAFIEKHINDIENEDVEQQYIGDSWRIISGSPSISESFLEKYSDFVDWETISEYRKLSEDFIIRNKDKIHKEQLLLYNENIPEELKRNLADKYGAAWDIDNYLDSGRG